MFRFSPLEGNGTIKGEGAAGDFLRKNEPDLSLIAGFKNLLKREGG